MRCALEPCAHDGSVPSQYNSFNQQVNSSRDSRQGWDDNQRSTLDNLLGRLTTKEHSAGQQGTVFGLESLHQGHKCDCVEERV